ncbi:MAG TPA: adenylate/guanylate cyclase domain-containing protein [Acidimicrobiia bacterium]|nr:adenylate/guanylate cyclase domain-containing protein [Acidimicrobiia bacterium]
MEGVSGYARSEGGHIAYRAAGEGTDILRVAGNLIAVGLLDEEPHAARYLRRLGSLGRLIQYDLRGVGQSDPVESGRDLSVELLASDARAVLDALHVDRAVVLCEGGSFATIALTLAANAPERVQALVLINATARTIAADDYPEGHPAERIERFVTENIDPDRKWVDPEAGADDVDLTAPSLARDDTFRQWWVEAGRKSASPATALALLGVVVRSDVRAALARITAPTLVLHTRRNVMTPVTQGRFLADHIEGARFVALPGADQSVWSGDTDRLLDEVEEFLTGRRGGSTERVLATVLFTDIVDSTRRAAELGDGAWRTVLETHDAVIRRELARYGGREVNTTGDGFVAAFESPTQAVRSASAIVNASSGAGIDVRAGLHTGECERRGDDLAGLAVHIAARVAAAAHPGEVLVSRTVRDLVGGSELRFTDRGEHELKGIPERWQLFALNP